MMTDNAKRPQQLDLGGRAPASRTSSERPLLADCGHRATNATWRSVPHNASFQLLPEAGAERTLEAVSCKALILMEAPSSAYHGGMLALGKGELANKEETS
jgi:hypothetical protein